ncbi:biotin synthase [Batrachochytrium salamandrivorans]|nr:biotin synthase [Batrachochytrium salamandrivorans]
MSFVYSLVSPDYRPRMEQGFSSVFLCLSKRLLQTSSSLHLAQPVADPAQTPYSSTANAPRNDWTKDQIQDVYNTPLIELLYQAATVHRQFFNPREVQQCTLLSIKTGGCSEDCSYCPQSSKHKTTVKATKLLGEDEVLDAARKARDAGSTRFCMGAAWRDVKGRKTNFKQIVEYVREIRGMGMEVCCTLGMLSSEQAVALKEAGLTAYNHNLDTSREFYPNASTIVCSSLLPVLMNVLIPSRTFVMLEFLYAQGIIGLGEKQEDRVGMLYTLATLPEHPESVPINALLAVPGTPLENQSAAEQTLCFVAGANSIFTGDKLLTTPNNEKSEDKAMFEALGVIPKPANHRQTSADAFLPEIPASDTAHIRKSTGKLVLEG